jgi:hypothetical protein
MSIKMIETMRKMRHALDLIDFSILTVFSRWTMAYLVSLCAYSILKSILSRIVPYSTTKTDNSLNNTAKSLIVATKF